MAVVKELQHQITSLQQQVTDLQKVDAYREQNQQQVQKALDALREQVLVGLQRATDASESTILLIDRTNLDQTWRRVYVNGGIRADYMKIKNFLVGSRACKQVRLYYSDIEKDMVPEMERADWQRRQDFYNFLRHQGWILRYVKKKVFDGIPVEKGLDAALIRDMETICRDGRCDTIILVAGDADYCEVVSEVQDRYCMKVEVAFFPNQTARDLSLSASKFINLECAKEKIFRT